MYFITFQEYNYKEHETFVFFLQYTNNEKAIEKLAYYVKNTNSDDLNGDFSVFDIDIQTKLSETTVDEICKVNIGTFGPLFTVCKGYFTFDESVFEKIGQDDWALKLDQLYYTCRIPDYFKLHQEQNNIEKQEFKNIFDAWDRNESHNDIYHLILNWINKHKNKYENMDLSPLFQNILNRMIEGDETNEIVEDFLFDSKYEAIRKKFKN